MNYANDVDYLIELARKHLLAARVWVNRARAFKTASKNSVTEESKDKYDKLTKRCIIEMQFHITTGKCTLLNAVTTPC